MSYLDDLLGKAIKFSGQLLPQRKVLNVIGSAAVSVADNPATGETDLTIDTSVPGTNTVTTAMIQNNAVTLAKLATQAALSVLANATNATDEPTAVAAATNGHIFRRLGTALGFGKILTNFITGTSTNDSATAGDLGEYVSSTTNFAGATTLTTATPANVTSISLTAGDWDLTTVVNMNGTLTGTECSIGPSPTTNSFTGVYEVATSPTMPTAVVNLTLSTPSVRLSLSATTTVYLVARCTFTVGTAKAFGRISARRPR